MAAPPPTVRLSWGRVPYPPPSDVVEPLSRSAALRLRPDLTYAPRGNGRSYGDSCLNPGAGLIETRHLDRFIGWDTQLGLLKCEGGTQLSEIIRFALPQGWFLPVTPGTKYVTVGGAIANDVHGKNHHVAGTFAHHVDAFDLLRSDGDLNETTRASNADRFAATVGGLGLTGLIVSATLRLKRVEGPWLEQQAVRFRSLDEFFEVDAALKPRHEYTVAWVDCVATGVERGRGLYMAADHAGHHPEVRIRRAGLRVPFDPPVSLVSPSTLRVFNWLYYHRPRQSGRRLIHYEKMFYPLDGVLEWNRIYGPHGFQQFQCVVPPAASRSAVSAVLDLIAEHRSGSFLAVLKTFGERPSEGFLSFPRPGTTFALDFPEHGERTRRLFSEMEAVVIDHGGALYPAKDGLMSAAAFKAGFPVWSRMRAHVDPRFSSQFARRVGLVV